MKKCFFLFTIAVILCCSKFSLNSKNYCAKILNQDENEVLVELNRIRKNPQVFIHELKQFYNMDSLSDECKKICTMLSQQANNKNLENSLILNDQAATEVNNLMKMLTASYRSKEIESISLENISNAKKQKNEIFSIYMGPYTGMKKIIIGILLNECRTQEDNKGVLFNNMYSKIGINLYFSKDAIGICVSE